VNESSGRASQISDTGGRNNETGARSFPPGSAARGGGAALQAGIHAALAGESGKSRTSDGDAPSAMRKTKSRALAGGRREGLRVLPNACARKADREIDYNERGIQGCLCDVLRGLFGVIGDMAGMTAEKAMCAEIGGGAS